MTLRPPIAHRLLDLLLSIRIRREKEVSLGLLGVSLLLWCISCPLTKRLPTPGAVQLDEPLLAAPVQVDAEEPPIEVEAGGIHFSVAPVADYSIAGLVVSEHKSDSFADYYHELWHDQLNVGDLCVVWGQNLSGGLYRRIDFWSEPFTCNFRTTDEEAWRAFRTNEISNNHLLAKNRTLRRQILSARVGDVVRIEGKLARYSNDRGFHRGTSLTREDTGDGACETIWVNRFEILRSENDFWRFLRSLSFWGILASVVLFARWMLRRPDYRTATGSVTPRPGTTPRPPPLPEVWADPGPQKPKD